MNKAESSQMTHKVNRSTSSSSPTTNEQSQEHMRLLMEASDLEKKQSLETLTTLPSEAPDSGKRQSVSSAEKQRLEQVQDQEIQEQEHQEAERGGDNGRERLKRHRRKVAGRVWIPEIWGQEEFLKDWIDCSAFDSCLVPTGISSARAALVQEARRAPSHGTFRLQNRCSILH
ncbi:PREDICTED: uncharacterized protein LOC104827509 [Tarenaya hassleriana]|uniref:uncharacterized protein LOC104827509 n=1 Tax=Tarenaya hassleriana TaxID=28532 RepID=UPI00053C1A49|nr:PREDICTED: uncharacterized protein LOC104827509 [Tarenaya hassleriana]